jgi:competence protein ComGC
VSAPPIGQSIFSRRERVAGYVALTKPRIIELLLVTTIIGVLVSLNLSAINGVTRRANEALCGVYKNQMKAFYYGDGGDGNPPSYTQRTFMQK